MQGSKGQRLLGVGPPKSRLCPSSREAKTLVVLQNTRRQGYVFSCHPCRYFQLSPVQDTRNVLGHASGGGSESSWRGGLLALAYLFIIQ